MGWKSSHSCTCAILDARTLCSTFSPPAASWLSCLLLEVAKAIQL